MTAYSPEYWAEWSALVDERDQAGAEYAGWALHHRQPVEDQGDTSAQARQVRADMQERAAQRWLALAAQVRQMERAEYQRSEQQKAVSL